MDEAERFMNSQLEGMKSLAGMGHPQAEAMMEDLARVRAAHATVSDQIRALDARGYSRADIARLLGKRYQHVRNVLEEDKLRAQAARKPAPSPAPDPRGLDPNVPRTAAPPSPEATSEARGFEPDASVHGNIVRLRIRPDGSVLLPPEVIKALEARVGGMIIGELQGEGELLLRGPGAAMRHIWTMIEPWKPGDALLSEELIADRREENRRESEGG